MHNMILLNENSSKKYCDEYNDLEGWKSPKEADEKDNFSRGAENTGNITMKIESGYGGLKETAGGLINS